MGNFGGERRDGCIVGVAFEYAFEFAVEFAVEFTVEFTVGDVRMSDLTIIYMTANRMPQRWVDFHLGHLLAAVGDFPLITVSSKPMDLGETNIVQDVPYGRWGTFLMWNKAAKAARTEYIAIAEDDSLYPPIHFRHFRPKADEVAYNMARWTVMSWHKEPRFSLLRRLGGFTMICSRELMIAALDEREAKYPRGHPRPGEIGREDSDVRMHVTRRKHVEWWSPIAVVNLAHPTGVSPTYLNNPKLKRQEGELKATEIPYWGKAADIVAHYTGVA